MTPRAVFLHTNGGGTGGPGVGLTPWFNRLWSDPSLGMAGQGIGATFQVFTDGQFDQLVDSTRVVFAQFQASRWSGAIETQDNGDPSTPWTDQQIAAIIDILAWYGSEHGVPMRLMQFPNDGGIGYHEQFSQWNADSHACPGTVRERQLLSVIIPALDSHNSPNVQGDSVVTDMPTITANDHTHNRFVHLARVALADAGWPIPVSDQNDATFNAGIKVVQGWAGLAVDGVLGEQTWPAVLKIGPYAKKALPKS